MAESCPVCNVEVRKRERRDGLIYIECPRCGPYSVEESTLPLIGHYTKLDFKNSMLLSHVLYKRTRKDGTWPTLHYSTVQDIFKYSAFPSHRDQFDNLLLWVASKQESVGDTVKATEDAFSAICTADYMGLAFLVREAVRRGLMEVYGDDPINNASISFYPFALTLDGWSYVENLTLNRSDTKQAFMAMKFGEEELDAIYRDHFKAAVAATGFELKRLDEGQPAGLIDDRLRVEIRQSRFLIADLTHHNNGAYWEAGYAEGLGKPVIYTCRHDVFERDKERGTPGVHFDTNHHLTVIWNPSDLAPAMEKLKATVRATLPDDAKLTD